MAKPGPKPGTRPSGRQKGAPNKRSLELLQGLLAQDCIPAQQIAILLTSSDLHAAQKMECWEKLLPYLYPQQKAIAPDEYVTVEQAAGMLGAQVARFRQILERQIPDAALVAAILDGFRASKPQSPLENP